MFKNSPTKIYNNIKYKHHISMKKLTIILCALILSLNGIAQTTFEKGYYIDNNNKKIDCWIKNMDWANNPTEFNYKLSESDKPKSLTKEQVKEFAIDNQCKYVRHQVKMDRSSELYSEMDYDQNPTFNNEVLFLKVLVDGKATLYSYHGKGISRYFYNKDAANVEQLVYKSYRTEDENVRKNNAFRHQLWDSLKCSDISITEVTALNYKADELIQFFIKYNTCVSSDFVNYIALQKKQKKDLFNLTLRPGVKNSSLLIKNDSYNWKEIKFNAEFSFRFGVEAEIIMPFNNNKWAIVAEPTYQYFKSEKKIISNQTTGDQIITSVDYKSIEIPVSIRYYVFLNENSKFFANTSFIYDNILSSNIKMTRPDGNLFKSLDVMTSIDMAIGMGYKYKDKYSCELRYQFGRDIIGNYRAWESKLNSFSIVFGYTLF